MCKALRGGRRRDYFSFQNEFFLVGKRWPKRSALGEIERGIVKHASYELCICDIRFMQICITEIRLLAIRATQICPKEVSIAQIGSLEDHSTQIHSIKECL